MATLLDALPLTFSAESPQLHNLSDRSTSSSPSSSERTPRAVSRFSHCRNCDRRAMVTPSSPNANFCSPDCYWSHRLRATKSSTKVGISIRQERVEESLW
eukprot:TRINITY_DN54610_c0_g1_i1.p2 TRINITY_DN54610_c0_g1~~TRINITY_DN54610_c0_g1_i1.p2  ORF type:complete len:100 (-),score=10.68 TRINITY_DN54610_c0_g1_i1:216-515(-)